jgi:hypothetical protein
LIAALLATSEAVSAELRPSSTTRAAGDVCDVLGETVIDTSGSNIISCLKSSSPSDPNLHWYIAGTNAVPSCTQSGHGLVFDGVSFHCVSTLPQAPTCLIGQVLTSAGAELKCVYSDGSS